MTSALTGDRVIDAAIELADELGTDSLTMRKLGAALDLQAMSLYHYVPSKTALLNGMLERLLQRLDLPREDAIPWPEQLRHIACSFRRLALDHPSFVGLLTTQHIHTETALRPTEVILTILRNAGFGSESANRAYQTLTGYVLGAIFQESRGTIGLTCCTGGKETCDLPAAGMPEFSADRFPLLIETLRDPAVGHSDAAFEFGLDTIIAGLEARLSG